MDDLAAWLRDQIAQTREILEGIERGATYHRGIPGGDMEDVTDQHRSTLEDRLRRNEQLLSEIENE